jgi:uncharacterized protein (TIGR03437 family)
MRMLIVFLLLVSTVSAQQDRLSARIGSPRTVILPGNTKLQAQPQYDQGPVDPERRISGIMLVLKRTSSQQAELEKLLADQQDQSSPFYHQWLTPQQFAARFGLSPNDINRITEWLKGEGFSIDNVANARNWILFSGTAGEINRTFHTEIHNYRVDGQMHYANATDPSIPAALEPIVSRIFGLDDFHMKPGGRRRPPVPFKPDYNASDGSHALTPADITAIYDINALYAKGIDGTGQKIAVIGQTDINISDVELFRSQYQLGSNDPQKVLMKGSANPGIVQGDLGEANLDVDWSSAIAPKATIMFVYSTDIYDSATYAIDQNIAPVMTMSYGYCEAKISSTPAQDATAFQAQAQQANAQGITWVADAGDAGAADCDPDTATVATNGLAVNTPAVVPEVTSVGGTEFNEGSGSYWNPTNGSTGGSAKGYIPEMAWNDSSDGQELASGGGGASIFFSKPAWQTGPGVPNDKARDVPDISFAASWDHDGYWISMSGQMDCCWGGTSVATPIFAGILALLNQYQVSSGAQKTPGLGNINPTLYTLAQTTPGIFHDITTGSNIVPCTAGSPNCSGGKLGFSAGPGYDQATGLGSADGYNLVTQWSLKPPAATTTTAAASPASILVTGSTTVTATVKANTGTSTPTGTVSFGNGTSTLGTANLSGSAGTATGAITLAGNQLTTGSNSIKVSYSGNNGFSPSSGSTSITVTIPTVASAVVPSVVPDPVYQQTPDSDGYAWFFTVKLNEVAGTATTLTAFSIGGTDYSSDIASWFGTSTIPAHGTLSAALRMRNLTPPVTYVFSFSGADAGGATWTQQVTVPFYAKQISASMALSSSPGTVTQDTTGYTGCPSDYPYYQELNLQEKNGYEVYLNKFTDAGDDDSDSIEYWFGSWRLAPLGSLQAEICWSLDGAMPQTLDYEVDGVDPNGNKITTTLSVTFESAPKSPGALSVSRDSLVWSVSAGGSKTDSINVTVPAGQQWSLTVFPANQGTRWLTASPQSGTGPATVSLSANASGLAGGAYQALLVFQSVNTYPQFIDVPVLFGVGLTANVNITGLANGASFQQVYAPGMIMSVFGTNLSNSSTALYAPSVPLPTTMGGVSAQINGIPCGLYYASKTQLNIQVPYETPEGYAYLTVNNNGQVGVSDAFTIQASAPGIFVGSGNSLVPVATAKRGQSLTLFLTGDGDVLPFLASGTPPSASMNPLPAPRLSLTLTVAGITVKPDFVGIPTWAVGETQINFTVPQNTPLGAQSVVVQLGDTSSKAAAINVTQ